MESQTRCNDITSESIQNTSGKAKVERKFKLVDLNRLTFQLEGQEQVFDVESCTPEQFNAWAVEMADVEDVDVNVWPLETRRDLINDLWNFCQENGYEFPLTEIEDKSAPEAGGKLTNVVQ
jgi:hypothetical protein